MPAISVTTSHQLGQAEAVSRLKGYLEKIKQRHQDKVSNLEEQWTDSQLTYGFSSYGFSIKGDLAVTESAVTLNAAIPFAAMMFKGKIEQTMRDELARILA